MIWNDMTRKAFDIACEAHRGQVDKSGVPYILHPLRVAKNMPSDVLTAVALLHDVVEDTEWTLESLDYAGIPWSVLGAVSLLTHDKSVPYLDYVAGTLSNVYAAVVKKADLRHNSDRSRYPEELSEKEIQRLEKYARALEILKDVPDYYG